MLISKPMAALIGGILFYAALGVFPNRCEKAKHDYDLLNPEQGQTTAERIQALDSAARAAEIEALQQYEQADFNFMRGDAEIPRQLEIEQEQEK